ncbi:MAG: AAA family ATPase [Caldithrix sp.]|nr:AAA family ATPase [Caldithrix sp.]
MAMLTEKQQLALNIDKPISVTAGAGSGKTSILVERFLSIVSKNPQNIFHTLAITFTKKAAGEMKERVASRVAEMLKQCTDPGQRENLLTIRENLNSVHVSTIHSLCGRILREFPLEAGLSPDFREMDEMQSMVWQLKAIEESLKEIDEMPVDSALEQWGPLFRSAGRDKVELMLKEALDKPYEMGALIEQYAFWDETAYMRFLTTQWVEMVQQVIDTIDLKKVKDLVEGILSNDHTGVKSTTADKIRNVLVQYNEHSLGRNEMEDCEQIIALMDVLTTTDGTAKTAKGLGGKKNWPDATLQSLVHLSQILQPMSEELKTIKPGMPPGENDRRWFNDFKQFIKLYQRTEARYFQYKMDNGLVDFEDLQLLTLSLLKENSKIRNIIRTRFRFIMVDEFQDTNELQWQIVNLITGEGQYANNLFVVGDPKQSIYGFRNADVRVFKKVKQIFAQRYGLANEQEYPGNIIFDNSFRFLPGLNDVINGLFDQVLIEDRRNPFTVPYQYLKSSREVPGAGAARLTIIDPENPEGSSEIHYIASTIEQLLREKETCFVWDRQTQTEHERPLQYGDVAILLRSRNNLLEIEQAMRRRNIPFKTLKGIGYWQKQEIYDLFYLLKFLVNPDDDLALTAILRSKMFMLPDDALLLIAEAEGRHLLQKISNTIKQGMNGHDAYPEVEKANLLINKWLNCRHRMSLTELLNTILEDTRLKALLAADINGEQLSANVNKLIEHAQSFDAVGQTSLQDFLNLMEEILVTEMQEGEAQLIAEDTKTVKIMTIHAAKGLQFPVVFLPFLGVKNASRAPQVYFEEKTGMAATGLFKEKNQKDSASNLALINILRYQNRQKELAEARRIFYVGASRASNYLFMSAQTDKDQAPSDSSLEWIFQASSNYGASVHDIEQLKLGDLQIPVYHDYDRKQDDSPDLRRFFKGMEQLQTFVEQAQIEDIKEEQRFEPMRDVPGADTYSATRIMTFINDEQLYYQRYHLGFFENDYDRFAEDVVQSDDAALLKGKIVHRFLELLPTSEALPQHLMEQVLFEFDVFDEQAVFFYKNELLEILRKVKDTPQGRAIFSAVHFRNEVTITMRLDQDFFTGTIDRLYLNQENLWEVVDYKTNLIDQSEIEDTAKKYEWQVKAYAVLLSKLYPDQKIYPISLYFLHPNQVLRKQFDLEEVNRLEQSFISIINRIKQQMPQKLDND